MYYMGTILLGMSETEFWKCTPRKLIALWNIHKRVNGLDKEDKKEHSVSGGRHGYIDEIL